MGALQGQDALLSIVQMPKGVPVATVAIGNAYNAGLLAIQILAFGGKKDDAALRNVSSPLRRRCAKKFSRRRFKDSFREIKIDLLGQGLVRLNLNGELLLHSEIRVGERDLILPRGKLQMFDGSLLIPAQLT